MEVREEMVGAEKKEKKRSRKKEGGNTHLPVIHAISGGAPADDLNGVATQLSASLVGVHPLSVGEEIRVHGEGGGDGAIPVF